jgi:hypothetical protein
LSASLQVRGWSLRPLLPFPGPFQGTCSFDLSALVRARALHSACILQYPIHVCALIWVVLLVLAADLGFLSSPILAFPASAGLSAQPPPLSFPLLPLTAVSAPPQLLSFQAGQAQQLAALSQPLSFTTARHVAAGL